jgi:uncharacterized protein YbbK (DUF523 family)
MIARDLIIDALRRDPAIALYWNGGGRARIGVSACLLGEKVRYDGDDRRHNLVAALLPMLAEVVSLCPEVAIGLGVPRPTIQRVRLADGTDLVRGVEQRELLVGDRLDDYADAILREHRLHGYVFKARSPSCAPGNAPVFDDNDVLLGQGWGRYAGRLRKALPQAPMCDEEALATVGHLTAFIVDCYRVAAKA